MQATPYIHLLFMEVPFLWEEVSFLSGEHREALAELSTTSGLATTWNPAPDGIVRTIAASGTTLYIGGLFLTVAR